MVKPIIAVSLSDVVMKSTPWDKAHEVWFEHFAKKLNRPEIKDYAKKPDWFNYVDKVMALAESSLSETQRTIKAREIYFKVICDFGCDDPTLENKDVVKYLYSLKKSFSLGLVTTTPLKTTLKILKALKHSDLFDFVECSLLEEKDDKLAVFRRFIEKNGKPVLYLGGARKEVVAFCESQGIKFFSANFGGPKQPGSVTSVEDFQKIVKAL